MSRQIQIRRGTAAENDAFTGAIGEITMDTTNKTLRVHDGSTLGGTKLAKQSETNYSCVPNGTYTSFTVQSHAGSYTAPSDGYFVCFGYAASGSSVWIHNTTNGMGQSAPAGSPDTIVWCSLICKKDDIVNIGYYGGVLDWVRFYPIN